MSDTEGFFRPVRSVMAGFRASTEEPGNWGSRNFHRYRSSWSREGEPNLSHSTFAASSRESQHNFASFRFHA